MIDIMYNLCTCRTVDTSLPVNESNFSLSDITNYFVLYYNATYAHVSWTVHAYVQCYMQCDIIIKLHTYIRTCKSTVLFVHMQWESDREGIVQQGTKIIDILKKTMAGQGEAPGLPGTGCVQRAYEQLEKRFDEELGGFGNAPKFPQPSKLWPNTS